MVALCVCIPDGLPISPSSLQPNAPNPVLPLRLAAPSMSLLVIQGMS